jgi:hypothetical protein
LEIARRPSFVPPIAVAVIGAVGVTETMLARIGMERIIRNSMEISGQAARMGPGELEQAVERGAGIATVISHLSGLLGPFIFLLILAAIGLGVSNLVFGGQVGFRQSLAVASYAHLTMVLAMLLSLPVILFGDPERFNPQNPAPTNLGFFLNPYETSKPWMALATSLDPFTIWFLALLGIGYSEATGGRAGAWAVGGTLAALWLVWVLGKVGFALRF